MSSIQLVAAREAKNTIQPIAIKQCVQKYFFIEMKFWYKILSVSIVFLLYFIFLLNVYIYFQFFGGVKFVWDSSGYALWMTWKVVNFDFYENIKLIDSVSSTEWLIGFEWDSSPVGSEWQFGFVWDSSPAALNDCFVFWIALPQCGSQWLYRQQEEGMLNNYILYMPIILFEEDLRKLKLKF